MQIMWPIMFVEICQSIMLALIILIIIIIIIIIITSSGHFGISVHSSVSTLLPSHLVQSTLPPSSDSLPPCTWSLFIFHHPIRPTSQQVIPHQQRILICPPAVWNAPAPLVRAQPSMELFKHHLKTEDANMKPGQRKYGASDAIKNHFYNLILIDNT